MAEQTLPAVAKSVHTFCKKCDADRYHVVLAHKTATSAKVQCEICKSTKTYKLPAAEKPAAKKTKSGAPRKVGTPRGAAAKLAAHENEYESMVNSSNDSVPYSMKTKFASNQKIQHPKFGIGVVKAALQDKVEVVFKDEIRSLVHNRG